MKTMKEILELTHTIIKDAMGGALDEQEMELQEAIMGDPEISRSFDVGVLTAVYYIMRKMNK